MVLPGIFEGTEKYMYISWETLAAMSGMSPAWFIARGTELVNASNHCSSFLDANV
jgi:hypothetical protein